MSRERIRLSQRHQIAVYGSAGLLVVSGVLWLVAQKWLADGAAFGESASPLVAWSLKLHGAAAMAMLVVLGTLLPVHMRRAWNQRRSRRTGASVIAINGFLILTGYALYYLAGESTRATTSLLHWLVGLTLPVAMGVHVVLARRVGPSVPRWKARRGRAAIGHALPHLEEPKPGTPLHHAILDTRVPATRE